MRKMIFLWSLLRHLLCNETSISRLYPTLATIFLSIPPFLFHRLSTHPRLTLKAKSFAVKIPAKCSSSSTTKTQSVLFAAHSWEASATLMVWGTVKAGKGLKAETVPAARVGREGFLVRRVVGVEGFPDFLWSSVSIFLRIAYTNWWKVEEK